MGCIASQRQFMESVLVSAACLCLHQCRHSTLQCRPPPTSPTAAQVSRFWYDFEDGIHRIVDAALVALLVDWAGEWTWLGPITTYVLFN